MKSDSKADERRMPRLVRHLPTEFRGCMWNDGWNFDAPCVIYYPKQYQQFGCGGSIGHLESMVEDICSDIEDERKHNSGGLKSECEWRGWGKRFERRRAAHHVVFKVEWTEERGRMTPKIVSKSETYGPPTSEPNADVLARGESANPTNPQPQ